MRLDVRRRQHQRLMAAGCRSNAWAIENWLRAEAGYSGLWSAGYDVMAARVGLRTRTMARHAMAELVAIDPPLLVWDEERCIGYWLGTAVDEPCRSPRDYEARVRHAANFPSCRPVEVMLAELRAAQGGATPSSCKSVASRQGSLANRPGWFTADGAPSARERRVEYDPQEAA